MTTFPPLTGNYFFSQFCTAEAISVIQKPFPYYRSDFRTKEPIAVLQKRFLYYRNDFRTTGPTSHYKTDFRGVVVGSLGCGAAWCVLLWPAWVRSVVVRFGSNGCGTFRFALLRRYSSCACRRPCLHSLRVSGFWHAPLRSLLVIFAVFVSGSLCCGVGFAPLCCDVVKFTMLWHLEICSAGVHLGSL